MFKLPKRIIDEIETYKETLKDFLDGRTNSARFAGVRVPWGIYSHRGGEVFMTRIRIPAGLVNAEQLKAIAYVAKTYGNGMAHITTRQDIQLHQVKIEDTVKVIEYLKNYDLSPRGGGGNTVRNVTACSLAGICKDEVFDVMGYALSLSEHFLSYEDSFNLPRKFKIGFSACSKDCVGCLVNDIGLFAVVKDGKKGFRVFAGGGMGIESRTGQLLEDFIPDEELIYSVSAVKNVFYKYGNRRDKHHNRLRFLLEDLGLAKFKELYAQEIKTLKEKEYLSLRKIEFEYPEARNEETAQSQDEDFQEFLKYSVLSQRQNGLLTIELRIPRGDISADGLEKLADLEKEFTGIEFRTSQNQNIFVYNLNQGAIVVFHQKVKEILPDCLYSSTLLDVVCCKGALTCNLGLCNSPGLTQEVERIIKENFIGTNVFKKLNIKINGCPNACGQHPLGLIALHGVVRKVSQRPVPFYALLLGGRKDLENTRLAKDTGILIPGRNVPVFLKDFIARINLEISQETDIYKYMDEKAEALAKEISAQYAFVPAYSQDKSFYIDWGKTEEFSLEGLGPGECGVGVLDMIKADLIEAKIQLDKKEIKKSLFFAARALLVVRGIEPKDEESVLTNFIDRFVKEQIAPQRFSDLKEVYSRTDEKTIVYAQDFLDTVTQLFNSMDSSLNFPKQQAEVPKIEKSEHKVLDLKGTPCPINYVKAKLYLENLEAGDIVDILLDEGEPVDNVPKSLRNDGQEIVAVEKQDGFYKVTVKKNQ